MRPSLSTSAFAPILGLAVMLMACTPPQPGGGDRGTAPPKAPAAAPAPPAAASGAPPVSPAISPADAEAAALARELEIDRLYRAAAPFRRGGAFGLAFVGADATPLPAPPEAGAAWDKAAERLRGRFGALRPVTPLAADLAQGADAAQQTATMRLRRAGAAQGLDYLIVYRLSTTRTGARGVFSGGEEITARAEAAILDVRTGAVLGAVATDPAAGATQSDAQAAAMTALGVALDGLGKRLDADAMRATAPPL